jgi:AraC-like DNA-binding protein
VWHRHQPVGDLRRYRERYGRPVRFGCDRDALVLDRAALLRPLPLADSALSEYFLAQLEELTPPTTWSGRVAGEIERVLGSESPTLPDAARVLGVSPRTLQRQLSAEGTSFQELVAETRRRLAEELLGDGLHSISEVAFMLGFSEPSAFHRAFRRWTGTTPAVALAKAS